MKVKQSDGIKELKQLKDKTQLLILSHRIFRQMNKNKI